MAETTTKVSTQPAPHPSYRPLDHDKGEFRLLRIYPPTDSVPTDDNPLSFSPDPIRCELQYESLDLLAGRQRAKQSSMDSVLAYLLQDIPESHANDTEMDTGALMNLLTNRLGSRLSMDKEAVYTTIAERREALEPMYHSFNERMDAWQPEGVQFRRKGFEEWLGSWIWTPLSGDVGHLEHQSLSYFALSYTWRDQPQFHLGSQNRETELMVSASGLTMREALEQSGISPEEIAGVFGQNSNLTDDYVEITINDRPVLVGRNLEKALRTLREIPEIAAGTRVWVDALCINQQDVQEKNVQVKRMGDIYRKADRVLSYLGDDTEEAGHILEFMDAIGELMQRANVLAPLTHGFLKSMQVDMALSMARLFRRSYFSRIWIVQEIVLGGDKSIAICGARRFRWTNLLRCGKMLSAGMAAAMWNYDAELGPLQEAAEDDDYLTMGDLKDGITRLQMLRDAHIQTGQDVDQDKDDQRVPFSNTLWFRIPSSNRASDTRDLIYGMMNLLPKKLSDLVLVDYAKSNKFVDVMRAFAEAHITSTERLCWILHRFYSPFLGHQEWPTWVPNLAQQFSSVHWRWAVNAEGSPCPDVPYAVSFAVADKTKRPLLICRGMKIDIVHLATQNINEHALMQKVSIIQELASSLTPENAHQVYPMMEQLERSARKQQSRIIPEEADEGAASNEYTDKLSVASTHKYGDIEGLKNALQKCFDRLGVVLAGGQSIFNVPHDIAEEDDATLNQTLHSREFKAPTVTLFNTIRDLFADLKLWNTTFHDLFPAHVADVDPTSFSSPTIEDMGMTLARLFTTFGGYVGASLGNVRPGNELFLLAGCPMPVLLKKSLTDPDVYELQGGVYVPDIMGGEALTDEDHRGKIFETIKIA